MSHDTAILEWRGFHHLALATSAFDATLAFYHDVLGMLNGEDA